jgi:hypothetical protein
MRGDESFADDLNVELSTVSSEVALLLRPAEVKLVFSRFVLHSTSLPPLHCWSGSSPLLHWGIGRSLLKMEGRELVCCPRVC